MEHFFNIDIILRLIISLILGFTLGLERELTNKYAGLRTHILVCLGACIFTLLSIYGFPTFAPGDNIIVDNATGIRDTSRVAAQIVTGIGFIGAGTVLRNGPMVFGLTTAATLWIAASIGMACGAGMFGVAILSTIISVAVLTLIRIFERRILPSSSKHIGKYKITVYTSEENINKLYEFIEAKVDILKEFSSKKLIENPNKAKVCMVFYLINKKNINNIYKNFNENIETDAITLQEINE